MSDTELTLETFIEKFKKIKEQGWVKTHRSGTTGIGKTLEDLLGIDENNIQGPDYGTFELKSMRANAGSMLTLITKSPDEPPRANTLLRLKFGYSSAAYGNDAKVLHSTLSTNRYSPNPLGYKLKIACDDNHIMIVSLDSAQVKAVEAKWEIEKLIFKMDKKLGGQFIYVIAESRGAGANEEFHFTEAFLLNGFSSSGIIKLVREGKILIDLRIGQYNSGKNKGKTHDHGTGFRIFPRDYIHLFQKTRLV
ncbi:MAG: MvaI/BcnI family restriction endonuclease [Firmicutes bacterium]|nr:MvaI/BcnI family restriction endonuclease [Bacillota bacterium]